MTEKTLSQRLPVGAARNKVEFLADEFEKTAADLYALIKSLGGADDAPSDVSKNLLKNAGFLGAMDGSEYYGNNRWERPYATHDNNDSMSFSQQIAAPTCPNWGGEVKSLGGLPCSASFQSSRAHNQTQGAFAYGRNRSTQVLFQVFRMPSLNTKTLNKASCHVRLMSGGGNERTRFGIVKLDENLKAVGYVASKVVTAEGTFNEYDAWIDDIDLFNCGSQNLAFFIERLDVEQSMYSYVMGAGVSFVKSPFIPDTVYTDIDFDDQKFFKIATGINGADFTENMVIPFPPLNCPNGVNNHVAVHIVDANRITTSLSPNITMKMIKDGLLLTDVNGGYVGNDSMTFNVEGIYTKFINKIHYFEMPDYVAA